MTKCIFVLSFICLDVNHIEGCHKQPTNSFFISTDTHELAHESATTFGACEAFALFTSLSLCVYLMR